MRRHELSDEEWAIIAPLLPNKSRGVERVDDRRVISGVSELVALGGIFLSATALVRHFTIGSRAGAKLAFGTDFLKRYQGVTTAI